MMILNDPALPPHFHRDSLPHYHPNDAPYFVTYRLQGSIPKSEVARLHQLFINSKSPQAKAEFFNLYDQALDHNGPYHLKHEAIRAVIEQSLQYLNGQSIHIWAYCIMPNHVHLIFSLIDPRTSFDKIMQSHKRHTARQANIIRGTTGQKFWNRTSFDRVVREGKLGTIIYYVLNNPVKAGFVKHWRDWPGTYLSPDCHGFD